MSAVAFSSSPALAEADLLLLRHLCEGGDAASEAFAEIVRRYAGVVYAASLRVLGDADRAADVSQETFFRLFRQPRLVSQSLGGWLHRSATHLAIDVKRSEHSRRLREYTYGRRREEIHSELAIDHRAEPTWEQVSPHVDAALSEIPEPARSLLIRHFLQGVPQQDLAAELGVSPATISRRIKAGVEQLQVHLRGRGIYVSLAALAGFCLTHTSKAAPPQVLAELGKMQMVGPVSLGPPPPRGPGNVWPRVLRPRPWPQAEPIAKATVDAWAAGAGAVIVTAALALTLYASNARALLVPAPPVSHAPMHVERPCR